MTDQRVPTVQVADTLIDAQFARLTELRPQFAEWLGSLRERYSGNRHGDYPRWSAALEGLPEKLDELHPWRKGPWTFETVTIDTEWRSDWKWERLQPHLDWQGKDVLDIGCGNGYFGWQMLGCGARSVVGIDPTLVFCMQHLAAVALLGQADNFVLPGRGDELPNGALFDIALSMGVLYHHKAPERHIAETAASATGEVVIETLVVQNRPSIYPEGRYARMRNISVIPSIEDVSRWMVEAGLQNVRCVDVTPTTTDEQRSTPWMRFESLPEALDPDDPSRTVEGHPAPVRAILIGDVLEANRVPA